MRSGKRIERAGRYRRERRTVSAALAALLCLAACAASRPFGEGAAAKAGDLRPIEALEHPEATGRRVIWGGQIVEVVNHAGDTELNILSYPLDHRFRPEIDRPPGIRFVAVYAAFLDPALFAAGRFVSLVGMVGGERVIAVGSERHVAPLLAAEGIELWEESRDRGGPGRVSVTVGAAVRF